MKHTPTKLIIKILAIMTLLIGVSLLITGMVDYFLTIAQSSTPLDLFSRPLLLIYTSSPLLFLGFFFLVLGWGKKKGQID